MCVRRSGRARAKIPTRNGPIIRDFPLFTIQGGQVQSQSGVDLLKKIPLSEQVRDQVSITIEVRFIRQKRAMDVARRILREVTKVAEPYLNSYLVASQIIGSAIPLIDELTPSDRSPLSSTTTLIVPDDLKGKSKKLIAFALLPFQEKEDPKGREYLRKTHVLECDDMPGALCEADKPDSGITKDPAEITAESLDQLAPLTDDDRAAPTHRDHRPLVLRIAALGLVAAQQPDQRL